MRITPIVTRSQLTSRHLAKPRSLYFAYPILGEFKVPLSDADEELLDIIYYRLPSGAENLKRTWRGRYNKVDAEVGTVITRHFDGNGDIRIHDMAVSNAVTSLDWYNALQGQFPDRRVTLHASDLFDQVAIVAPSGSRWRVAFDAQGRALQFIGRRQVLQAGKQSPKHTGLIGRILIRWLERHILPSAIATLTENGPNETYSLYHPRARTVAEADGHFTLGHHDLFQVEGTTYDVVRLMSTVKSLSPDKIAPMFRALSASVRDGGLFVAGQNRDKKRDEIIPTTIFHRCGTRFEAVHDILGGYDTRDLVLSLDLPPARS